MKEIDVDTINQIRAGKPKISTDVKMKIMLELYNSSTITKAITIKDFRKVYKRYKKNLKNYSLYKVLIVLYDEGAISLQKRTCFYGKSTTDEELKNYIDMFLKNKIIAELKLNENEITKYMLKKLENQNKKMDKITQDLNNYSKDILTIMALFVSIVALLTANVSALGNLTAIGIITMNISLAISILIIFLLINNLVGKESSKFTNNIVSIVSIIILTIILLILVFKNNLDSTLPNNEKDSINNNYNPSFQFDIKGGNDN